MPETVKRRVLKPLFPNKYRPPRPPPMWKDRESKAILEQFDPLPHQKAVRTVQDYQQEILEVFEEEQRHELVFYRTPWVISSFLRGWRMDSPKGHPSGVDVKAFMQEVEPRIHDKRREGRGGWSTECRPSGWTSQDISRSGVVLISHFRLH